MFGSRLLNNRIRASVLVTLKTGDAFEGVLWDADRQVVVLRNAVQVGVQGAGNATVDGEVVVLLGDVAFMQVLG